MSPVSPIFHIVSTVKVLGCFMPTSLYLTAHQPAKRARLTRSSICSISLALDIEDGCQQVS